MLLRLEGEKREGIYCGIFTLEALGDDPRGTGGHKRVFGWWFLGVSV